MPKQVDHDERRAEIANATWRLIAERGIEATTMRAISSAIGMAHGALKHYFPDKNALIKTAFTHVFDATNTRIRERLGEATGLAGLRIFCLEVLPIEDVTKLEARVVIPFWQRALADAGLQSVFTDAMNVWRQQIHAFLRAARADGSVRASTPDEAIVEHLLAMLNGAQILAVLTSDTTTPKLQQQMIDSFLEGLG
ncbi:MAG: TetR family transcriptional regulator [Pseudonocardiaceae bacterium]|nr:TetR family transcriptional regulator [Pseudonocardiaceae bacterium]